MANNPINPIPYSAENAAKLNRQAGPRVDTGYAVSTPDVDPNTLNNWTARLIKTNNKYLNLWVEEASIDFSMTGSTGQSRWKREFYPHSFDQPILKMAGIMPNQREYNKLAAFVRESHSEALNVNGDIRPQSNASEKSNIYYKHYGDDATIPLPTVTLIMNPRSVEGRPRNQKGGRKGMQLEGYIKSIAAGGTKFNFAPQFSIEFVIAQSDGSKGIFGDNLSSGSKITDWMTLFRKDDFGAKNGAQIRKDILQSQYDDAVSSGKYISARGGVSDTAFTGAQINHRGTGIQVGMDRKINQFDLTDANGN